MIRSWLQDALHTRQTERISTRTYGTDSGGTHWGAIVFAGTIGLILLTVALTRGGETPAARPAPTAQASIAPSVSSVAPPKPSELDSVWVSQSPSPTIAIGGDATISFAFRNTGQVPWVRGTASEARLGYVGNNSQFDPRMAIDWPNPQRPAAQTEAVVAPGQPATFTFKVRGVVAGTFRIDVRPVVDGVAWLPDQGVYVEVTVR